MLLLFFKNNLESIIRIKNPSVSRTESFQSHLRIPKKTGPVILPKSGKGLFMRGPGQLGSYLDFPLVHSHLNFALLVGSIDSNVLPV